MQGRYFATFGAEQLEDFEIPGGPMSVMLVSELGQTENEFRTFLHDDPMFDNKYCTTYPIEDAHDMHINYSMVQYTLDELMDWRL